MTISSRREATWFKPSGYKHADVHNKNGHAATLPPPSLSLLLCLNTASQLAQQRFLSSDLLSQPEPLKDLMLVCVCVLDIRAGTSLDSRTRFLEEECRRKDTILVQYLQFDKKSLTFISLYMQFPHLPLGVHASGCMFIVCKKTKTRQFECVCVVVVVLHAVTAQARHSNADRLWLPVL